MEYFTSKAVWEKVTRSSARAATGKNPISVRWVDVNKGDEVVTNYRSRLVAREMRHMGDPGASFFAPAPPLEALRTVLSLATTRIGRHMPDLRPESKTRTQVSLIDIKRAYFNAEIGTRDNPTFVDLPDEDQDKATMCAQLLRQMYGTRGAAHRLQEEYITTLLSLSLIHI